jgi:hypothetical protein
MLTKTQAVGLGWYDLAPSVLLSRRLVGGCRRQTSISYGRSGVAFAFVAVGLVLRRLRGLAPQPLAEFGNRFVCPRNSPFDE